MTAQLRFLGTGSATDFERGQTSVLYEGRATILVDCGPQIPHAYVVRCGDPEALDAVYITHQHADHCFGLGSLLLWMRLMGRKGPLKLCAGAETLEVVRELLTLGYPGAFAVSKCFPIEYLSLAAGATQELAANGGTSVGLSVAPTTHNVRNLSLRIDDAGQSCAISGDGLAIAETRSLYAGCSTVVQECALLHPGQGLHMSVPQIVDLYHAVRPRRLCIVHCLKEARAAITSALLGALPQGVVFPEPGSVLRLSD